MRLSWVLRRRRSICWRTGGSDVRAIAPPRTTRPVGQLSKTVKVQGIIGLFRLPRLYFRKGDSRKSTDPKPEHAQRQLARTMNIDEIHALILETIQNPDEIWEAAIGPNEDPNAKARALYFMDHGKNVGRDLSMGKVAANANGPRANDVSGVSVVVARTLVGFQTVPGPPVVMPVAEPVFGPPCTFYGENGPQVRQEVLGYNWVDRWVCPPVQLPCY